jgi:hypothetical protein
MFEWEAKIALIEALFLETRKDRLYFRSRGQFGYIEATCCAVREQALLEAMKILGVPVEKLRQLDCTGGKINAVRI